MNEERLARASRFLCQNHFMQQIDFRYVINML